MVSEQPLNWRVDIDLLKKTNRRLAKSLDMLRAMKDWMDLGVDGCSSVAGMLGAINTTKSIPIARDALEEAFFKATGPERISEDMYDKIKTEIDYMEYYVSTYPVLFDELCDCERH